jgi:pimeloyl-ACP methyl ester carboxylesterase
VLESGIAASSLSWAIVERGLVDFAHVVSYDRAGFGWSDSAPERRTPHQLAKELHGVLEAAAIAPPYVLVGHSFGGLIVRAFAILFPAELAGLVLVDALSAREWCNPDRQRRRMLRGGTLFSWAGALLSSIGVVRLCLYLLGRGSKGAPRAVLRSFGTAATTTVQRIVGEVAKLPREVWPYVRAYWSLPSSFSTMARYFGDLPRSSEEMLQTAPAAAIPTVVLSAQCADPRRSDWQREIVSLHPRAEHQIVANCGHWVQLDRPDLVVAAIRRVLDKAAASATRTREISAG